MCLILNSYLLSCIIQMALKKSCCCLSLRLGTLLILQVYTVSTYETFKLDRFLFGVGKCELTERFGIRSRICFGILRINFFKSLKKHPKGHNKRAKKIFDFVSKVWLRKKYLIIQFVNIFYNRNYIIVVLLNFSF